MRSLILRSRESFWFLPSVFGLIAVGLGLGLVALDHVLRTNGFIDANFADTISATGGRSILVIIGGSMLTVAGTSFSPFLMIANEMTSQFGSSLRRASGKNARISTRSRLRFGSAMTRTLSDQMPCAGPLA